MAAKYMDIMREKLEYRYLLELRNLLKSHFSVTHGSSLRTDHYFFSPLGCAGMFLVHKGFVQELFKVNTGPGW